MDRLPQLFPPLPEFKSGEVWLVGAGPGDPSHLTILALHALRLADCVVYDALVDPRILDLANENAVRRFAGKRGGRPSSKQSDINEALIDFARAGHKVVRLKSGDPFVFGRGGEEVAALANAGIPYRIVPGITSGLAAAALTGIPATTRETNHALILAAGHHAVGEQSNEHWEALARVGQPIILYMPMSNLEKITAALQRGGLKADTPVAVIASVSTPQERILDTCLKDLVSEVKAERIEPPAIVVVGKIAALRR